MNRIELFVCTRRSLMFWRIIALFLISQFCLPLTRVSFAEVEPPREASGPPAQEED